MQVWFSFFEEKKEKTDFIKENQFSAPEKEQKRREVWFLLFF